jgi:hypothetical protein
MFWRRATGHGAFFGLLIGTISAAVHHGLTLPRDAVPGLKGAFLVHGESSACEGLKAKLLAQGVPRVEVLEPGVPAALSGAGATEPSPVAAPSALLPLPPLSRSGGRSEDEGQAEEPEVHRHLRPRRQRVRL